jgi:hypothetical protein
MCWMIAGEMVPGRECPSSIAQPKAPALRQPDRRLQLGGKESASLIAKGLLHSRRL